MTHPPLIPIEELFADPVRSGATISPDGTRIAHLAPENGRLNVWVQDIHGGEPMCVTHDHSRGIRNYRWTDDPRWLLYLQDSGGDEAWHLYRVDLEDPESPAVDLTPMAPASRVVSFELPSQMPGMALVCMNWPRLLQIDVHALDLATGELSLYAENPGNVQGWTFSSSGDVLAYVQNEEYDLQLALLDRDSGELRTVATHPGQDHPIGVHPIHFTPDGTGLWLGSFRDSNHVRLVHVGLETGEETLVDSLAGHDLDIMGVADPTLPQPLILSRSGELLGARYVGERQIIRALDPHFAEVHQHLSTLSDGDLAGLSCDASQQRWVASFNHDTDPGVTWLYDHATGESQLLFRAHPHLDPATLAPMHPVTVTSRDGLSLPCHLTLPVDVEPSGLPMVLLVHGGPWFRDAWGFDKRVQFLANRGYAVLQVNFRGSVGFGKAFMKSAMGELAGKMHDDLLDAVEWAVKQGYADPSRVAIFGGSYGGYAALVGASFTPDMFAAAIDYVGISSLPNFIRTLPPFVRPMVYNNWTRYAGDPEIPEQEADMLARSPITRVDQITIPLLVIQGANDARVVKAESDNIVAALRARGVEVEYLVKDDEGHGFQNPENVMDMYRAIEPFLATHLG